MKISKSDLQEKYGITLPSGKYMVHTKADHYEIYSVRDDTEGCLIVGQERIENYVRNSKLAFDALLEKMKMAWAKDEEVWITIT